MTDDIKDQVAALQKDFRKLNEKAHTGLAKAILTAAYNVESTAKKMVSRGRTAESIDGAPPRVDTGRLRASITHRLKSTDTSVYADVGTNVEYAPELEFGSSARKWKHPFMTPALDKNEKETARLIDEAIGEAVDNA
jgi:HK97 gp10 family phage protein